MCKTVAIYRAMNGYSAVRIGGTGARSAAPIFGDQIHHRAYGWQSAGQMFAPTFLRHMYDYGTTPEQVAAVKVAHSKHASNNHKAYYKKTLHGRRSSLFPYNL
jgi:acetyl-CoA acetyltransferase